MIDILTTQVKGVLENAVFTQISKQGTGLSSSVLRALSSRVAEEISVLVTQSVTVTTNQQINTIPSNLLGSLNPVDLVTKNLGSTGVSNNLLNILNTQLNAQLTNKLVTSIEGQLRQLIPADRQGLINVSAVAGTLTQLLTPTISSTIGTVLNSVTGDIFTRDQATLSLIPNVSDIFTNARTEEQFNTSLEQLDNQYTSAIATKYLAQARTFNTNNEDNKAKLQTLRQGFIDPTANYPTPDYAGKAETNKLAQGDAIGTVVQAKNTERVIGARLPNGESWEQPPSSFRGTYPYNKVTQTESGHIIEIDDTPGAERIHIYHRSGTFIEVDANGTVVSRTKGSKYEIIDKNGKISINGKADISINGACNIFVGNDANIEVEGDTNLICYNDITAQAGGKLNLSAVEELNITSGNVNIEAYHNMNVKSNLSLTASVNDIMTLRSNVDLYVQSQALYQNTTNSFVQTVENLHNKIGGSGFTQTTGSLHFITGDNLNADTAGELHLNSGNAQSATQSRSSNIAGSSGIGVMMGRKDVLDVVIADPVAITVADPYALKLEEDLSTDSELTEHKDRLLTLGITTSEDFDFVPSAIDTDESISSQTIDIIPDETLKNYTELPGNFNLSPSFTVEMVTSKASLTKFDVQPEEGLTYGEIIFNLAGVALNILEPAYNIFPKLVVASGYRPSSESSINSVHPKGKCVDIQFQGVPEEEYYDYARFLAKVLNYDQLILHYCSYTSSPWIHISYDGGNNRKQVMTYWNNRKYSDNLSRLK